MTISQTENEFIINCIKNGQNCAREIINTAGKHDLQWAMRRLKKLEAAGIVQRVGFKQAGGLRNNCGPSRVYAIISDKDYIDP